MPIILIGIGITVFFTFTNPIYNDISTLKAQASSYDDALGNSKSLENARDTLTTKENAIDPVNLTKLQTLLPDNIDNIRLILEIGQIAAPYGMVLKDVKYNATDTTTPASSATPNIQGGTQATQTASKDYGVWDLEFSTTGTYSNFLNFTRDLENNLRIVDISSIQFSSASSVSPNPTSSSSAPDSYKYSFKIKTYWLKN
jgi:Tfp pilus assembly protein PilO